MTRLFAAHHSSVGTICDATEGRLGKALRHRRGRNWIALTAGKEVSIFVFTMDRYIATVIRTGNSIALRVPKQYVLDAKLVPGEKVSLGLPTKQKPQDPTKIARLIAKLQQLHAFGAISDPTAWQREIRRDRPLPGRSS